MIPKFDDTVRSANSLTLYLVAHYRHSPDNNKASTETSHFSKHSSNITKWIQLTTLCLKKRHTLPIINRFSKFFHWHTLYTIDNKAIIEYPTTP